MSLSKSLGIAIVLMLVQASNITAQSVVTATMPVPVLGTSARFHATPGVIDLDLSNVPLRRAIDDIAYRGDVRIAYGKSVESSRRVVSIKASRITVTQALQ